MSDNDEIEVIRLFNKLEKLRTETQTTIDKASFITHVTPLAYKNWKNHGAIPSALQEPTFRDAIVYLKRLQQRQHSEEEYWVGRTVHVMRDTEQQFAGDVLVKQRCKNGLYLCVTSEGEEIKISLTDLKEYNGR